MSNVEDPLRTQALLVLGNHPPDAPAVVASLADWCGHCKRYTESGIFKVAAKRSPVAFKECYISFSGADQAPEGSELKARADAGDAFATVFAPAASDGTREPIHSYPTIIGFRNVRSTPVLFEGDRDSLEELLAFAARFEAPPPRRWWLW